MRDVTPVEALDAKLSAIVHLRRTLDYVKARIDGGDERLRAIRDSDPIMRNPNNARETSMALAVSVPVAWSAGCMRGVQAAAESYPTDSWPPIPTDQRAKFYVFGEPLGTLHAQQPIDRLATIDGIVVGVGTSSKTGQPGLVMRILSRGFTDGPIGSAMNVIASYDAQWGDDFLALDDTADMYWTAERRMVTKFVFASWSFLDQRIAIEEPAHVERHAAKRAQRLDIDPVAHVVRFRKSEARRHGECPGHDVEWSCQWLVRGHWRNQWHPRMQRHAPVWILPHIKGPADMPLKTPAPEVWQVAR